MPATRKPNCGKCGTLKLTNAKGDLYCPTCVNAATRRWYQANAERVRTTKRIDMAARRADPIQNAAINAARKTPEAHRKAKAWRDHIRDRHFFRHRARVWSGRHRVKVTAVQLAGLWLRQRGRCALSGTKLDRTAELDHIAPVTRGGPSTIDNLQWTTSAANDAKANLSVEEFVALCRDVVAWRETILK